MSLVSDVRMLVNESSEAFWLDESIYDAINRTQLSIFANNPRIVETSTTFVLGSGVEWVAIPASIMIPKYVIGTSSEHIFPVTQTALEQYNIHWKSIDPSYPSRFVMYDAFTLRPYPRADVNYTFTMYGVPWPTEMTNSVQDITASRYLKRAITYAAAAQLLSYTRPELSDQYMKDSDEAILMYRQQLRNQHGHNIMRLRPANAAQRDHRGNIIRWSRY